MNLPLLIGSIVGVLILAWAAWMLGLGGASIPDEAEARRLAEESDVTFTATEAWVSTDHKSALVHGRDGSWTVLKVHGAQVASRRLQELNVRATDAGVIATTGERMFGDVELKLAPQQREALLNLTRSSA